ncbi:hypothetical protein [Streptomyces sp. NPDC047108]|uniref:hypothetical protein n=1 Tax=Streptomyces sp. NPDC047108 TaxID=3155025 RepID=UPI0033F678D5
MHRLLAAALTCVVSAALAVATAFGIVAALHATPEQPNVPLVSFPDGPPPPSEAPSQSSDPSSPQLSRQPGQ